MSNSTSSANGAGTHDRRQNQPGVDGDSQDRDTPDGWTDEYRHPGYSQRQVAALKRKVRTLTAELERKDAHLEEVIRQYERRLEEKNRTLAEQESGDDGETTLSPLRRLLDR